MATTARVPSGVVRPVWWLGQAETCAPMAETGYPKLVPCWMVSRSTASVSSLHQICGK